MDLQKKREFDQQNAAQLNEEAAANVVILIDDVTINPPTIRNFNGQVISSGQVPARQIALGISSGTLSPADPDE